MIKPLVITALLLLCSVGGSSWTPFDGLPLYSSGDVGNKLERDSAAVGVSSRDIVTSETTEALLTRFVVEPNFYAILGDVLEARVAILDTIKELDAAILEKPIAIQKLDSFLREAIGTHQALADCYFVSLVESIPESIKETFHEHVRRNTYLSFVQTLPIDLACSLLKHREQQIAHKRDAQIIAEGRLRIVRDFHVESVAEIDDAFMQRDTPSDLHRWWNKYLSLESGPLGEWTRRIVQNSKIFKRIEEIKKELNAFKVNELFKMPRQVAPSSNPSMGAIASWSFELRRILDLYCNEGRDILFGTSDSLALRFLRSLVPIAGKKAVFDLIGGTIDGYMAHKRRLADEQQTLMFQVTGLSPVGKYRA
jgi:hypothetical protein